MQDIDRTRLSAMVQRGTDSSSARGSFQGVTLRRIRVECDYIEHWENATLLVTDGWSIDAFPEPDNSEITITAGGSSAATDVG